MAVLIFVFSAVGDDICENFVEAEIEGVGGGGGDVILR